MDPLILDPTIPAPLWRRLAADAMWATLDDPTPKPDAWCERVTRYAEDGLWTREDCDRRDPPRVHSSLAEMEAHERTNRDMLQAQVQDERPGQLTPSLWAALSITEARLEHVAALRAERKARQDRVTQARRDYRSRPVQAPTSLPRDWTDRVKALPLSEVIGALSPGVGRHRGRLGPCPCCGKDRDSAGRGPVLVKGDSWHCFGCSAGGDSLAWACAALTGSPAPSGDDFLRVGQTCAATWRLDV